MEIIMIFLKIFALLVSGALIYLKIQDGFFDINNDEDDHHTHTFKLLHFFEFAFSHP